MSYIEDQWMGLETETHICKILCCVRFLTDDEWYPTTGYVIPAHQICKATCRRRQRVIIRGTQIAPR